MTLSFDPATLRLPKGHFIDGRYVKGADELEIRRPSDGKPLAAIPVADAALVDEAIRISARVQRESDWATCMPRDRARILRRFADLIDEEAGYLAQLEAVCSTRPITQARQSDVVNCADHIRFFAEFADKEGGQVVPTADAQMGMILHEPYGVIGAIAPWNVPLSMAAWKLGPALAAGNGIVIKPSEMTPFSTLYLAELAVRAGIPAGLVNVVLGDGPVTGTAITTHPLVGKVSFTGSTRAGAQIMQDIARTGIKPMTLELGGKSPQVVFADADIDLAAACIARSITGNAGQVCVAGSRLIAEKSVAQELATKIAVHMATMRPGKTWDADTTYSPIISETQIARIEAIVDAAKSAGAEVVAGGCRMQSDGYFYAPTILAGVDETNPAVTEEIFGPVLSIQTFETEEEATALATHPTYGLASGLFTRDLSRAIRMSRKLEAGTVWVNRYGRSRDMILPTGGYKSSGLGKDLGREAYMGAMRTKSVLIDL